MKLVLALLLATISILLSPTAAHAVTTPSYPSCLAPQGTVLANYENGTHGIAGDSKEYTGKDSVYKINDAQVLQCFCQNSGQGIQTNWLKATNFSEDDRKVMENDGWIFVANGSLWGLDPQAYFAKNVNYSCLGSQTGVTNGVSVTNPATAVLAAATSFAGTGNIVTTLSIFTIGLFSLFVAIYLKRIR